MPRQYTLQRAHSSFTGAIDYAAELNEQQLAAVTAPPGPLLVIAGAGSGVDPKEMRFPKADVLADIFSFVVNTERPMEELLAEKFPYFLPLLEQIKDVHARYERKKKATNSLDFDDLLEKTLRMLLEHEHIARVYRRQFQFILVDEYQDTNKIQADFIDVLAREHQNVMVVGDDAQSIHSWRGAKFPD